VDTGKEQAARRKGPGHTLKGGTFLLVAFIEKPGQGAGGPSITIARIGQENAATAAYQPEEHTGTRGQNSGSSDRANRGLHEIRECWAALELCRYNSYDQAFGQQCTGKEQDKQGREQEIAESSISMCFLGMQAQ